MEVFGKYELQRLIRDGEIRTFSARELQSGRMLLVHQLGLESGIFEAVQHLAPADLGLLVSAGQIEGRRYIVTYDVPMLHDFERFVTERTPAVPSVSASKARPVSQPDDFARLFGLEPNPAQEPLPSSPPLKEPGEFTRMFQSPVAQSGTPNPKLPEPKKERDPGEFTRFLRVGGAPTTSDDATKVFSLPPTSPIPPKPATTFQSAEATKLFETPVTPAVTPQLPPAKQPAPAAEPGEFTKMFRALSPASPAAAPLSPEPPAPSTGAGEFTQMFQAPSAPEPSGAVKPASAEPGSFTKFFSPGLVSSPVPEYPKSVQEPARPLERDPSEFTNMFGRPSDGQQEAEAPLVSTDPVSGGGATSIFSRPATRQTEIAPPQSFAKGEYTRIFQAPAALPAQEQPAQASARLAQQPAPTTSARSSLPLILILSILGVLGIILILYFALKK